MPFVICHIVLFFVFIGTSIALDDEHSSGLVHPEYPISRPVIEKDSEEPKESYIDSLELKLEIFNSVNLTPNQSDVGE